MKAIQNLLTFMALILIFVMGASLIVAFAKLLIALLFN